MPRLSGGVVVLFSEAVSLPKEVLEILSRSRGVSIVVKGRPGTGKTIFALSTCSVLSESHECFYVTARSTPDEFLEDYPIAKDLIDERRIIDVTESKAEVKLDAISFRMYDKPSFLQRLYFMVRERRKPPIIVVDSLEALKNSLRISKEDLNLEEALIDIARETEGKIIFILERFDISPLDFIADGVITLMKENNETFFRIIKLEKLRGISIKNPSYLFTLEEGRFYAVMPEKLSIVQKIIRSEGKFDLGYYESPFNEYISTGIKQLDELIGGGYLKGSLNIIEVARGVGERYDYLYIPTMINQVMGGRKVALIPPGGVSATFMMHVILKVLPETKVKNQVTFVEFKEEVEKEKNELIFEGKNLLQEFEAILRCIGKEGLIIAGMDTLQHVYGLDEMKKSLGRLIARIKRHNMVMVGITKYEQEIVDLLNHLAESHLRVKNVNGNVVVYGLIPHTPTFHPYLPEGERLEVKLKVII